ncbi:hypothetical protein FBY35_1019 [Streptomyces sp. SLBN-118]|nr:hypothetical protein FBY35_1019 [Streptomyces sp. SLBN-118]
MSDMTNTVVTSDHDVQNLHRLMVPVGRPFDQVKPDL